MSSPTGPTRSLLAHRFELLRELGSGGMGEVWEAFDHEVGARVALKILHERDGEAVLRLKAEFRSARDIRHRNLVKLGELVGGERWFFTMELVQGVGLLDWLRPDAPAGAVHVASTARASIIDPRVAGGGDVPVMTAPSRRWDQQTAPFRPRYDETRLREALPQLAAALDALHARGVIHRDLKPSNVLVDAAGRVVVLDFGLAISAADTPADQIAGTIDYMAPEQAQAGPLTPAADFYAVGVMLYEVLVGRPPFQGPVMEVLLRKSATTPIPPMAMFPEIPVDLDRLCMALLECDPARRASFEAFAGLSPMPRRRRRRGGVLARDARPLVGRDAELARLLEIVDESARSGAPSVTLVHGASGVGKSALLDELATRAAAGGALVLSGRCLEAEDIRYKAADAIVDVLSRYLASLPPAQRMALVNDDDAALARVFPSFERVVPLPPAPAPLTAEAAERLAIRSLRGLLERLGRAMPLVAIVDDLQWSTPESLRFFLGVMAPPRPPQLAFLGAVVTSAHATEMFRRRVAEMEMVPVEVHNLVLLPLAHAAAAQLARQLLGGDQARAEEIAAASRGVPLHITQLALGRSSELEPVGGGAGSIRADATGAPLDALDDAQLAALAVVCAAIGPIRYENLAQVLDEELSTLMTRVDELRALRLVKTTGLRRGDMIEPFHEQTRLALRARVGPARLAAAHLGLGRWSEAEGHHLGHAAQHFRLAGDTEAAVRVVRRAVAAARHAVALQRAAEVCAGVLSMELSTEQTVEVTALHAEALAGAGETSRAADAYLASCALAPADAALELRRRAAEQLLRCGRLTEGLAEARAIAAAVGLRLPRTPLTALARLVTERARMAMRLRGLRPAAGAVRPATTRRADVCYTLSVGLAMVDFVTAGVFQTRATRLSLDSGDAYRAARGLALEACFTAAAGARTAARVERLIAAADALQRPLDRTEIAGLIAAARGISAQLFGRYDEAVPHCDQAVALFQRAARGTSWEQVTVEQFALWSLGWLGRWDEIQRRLPALRAQAEARADRFAMTFLALGMTVCGDLGADRAADARQRAHDAIRAWPAAAGTFQTPHLHELVALSAIDLYEGLAASALDRLDQRWPALARSRLLRVEQLAAMMWELRLRAGVAAGLSDRPRLAQAAALTRRLAGVRWMEAPVALAEAALAAARGDDAAAAVRLEQAAAAGDRDGLALHAAAARVRWGRLMGGDEGQRVRVAAADAARRRGVVRPLEALAALAPWPSRASGA